MLQGACDPIYNKVKITAKEKRIKCFFLHQICGILECWSYRAHIIILRSAYGTHVPHFEPT